MKNEINLNRGEIAFKGDLHKETLWATQAQIASLFAVDRSVVTTHMTNIFADKELNKKVVSAKFAQTTPHGAIPGKTQTKDVLFYNLDIILAVGYRTNSSVAISFRKWATKVLRQHITKGYTINKKRIVKNYSDPKNKDKIIGLILQLLKNNIYDIAQLPKNLG